MPCGTRIFQYRSDLGYAMRHTQFPVSVGFRLCTWGAFHLKGYQLDGIAPINVVAVGLCQWCTPHVCSITHWFFDWLTTSIGNCQYITGWEIPYICWNQYAAPWSLLHWWSCYFDWNMYGLCQRHFLMYLKRNRYWYVWCSYHQIILNTGTRTQDHLYVQRSIGIQFKSLYW